MSITRQIARRVVAEEALLITAAKSVTVGMAHEVSFASSFGANVTRAPEPPSNDDRAGPTKRGRDWMDWTNLAVNIGRLVWTIGKDMLTRLSAHLEHPQQKSASPDRA